MRKTLKTILINYSIIMLCINSFADQPTEVQLGIYVNSFYSISEQTMVCKHF